MIILLWANHKWLEKYRQISCLADQGKCRSSSSHINAFKITLRMLLEGVLEGCYWKPEGFYQDGILIKAIVDKFIIRSLRHYGHSIKIVKTPPITPF